MSQDRGKTLVIVLDRYLRHVITPATDKLLHAGQILTGLPIGLPWFTDNNTLYGFTGHIITQIIEQS